MIFSPVTISEIMGKMVPQNTANSAPMKIRLFRTKPASREKSESSSFSLFRASRRSYTRAAEPRNMRPIKPRKNGPRLDWVKE